MALTSAQRSQKRRDKKTESGLRKLPDKYVNAKNFDTYNEQVDKTIKRIDKQLNQKYNMMKIGE